MHKTTFSEKINKNQSTVWRTRDPSWAFKYSKIHKYQNLKMMYLNKKIIYTKTCSFIWWIYARLHNLKCRQKSLFLHFYVGISRKLQRIWFSVPRIQIQCTTFLKKYIQVSASNTYYFLKLLCKTFLNITFSIWQIF